MGGLISKCLKRNIVAESIYPSPSVSFQHIKTADETKKSDAKFHKNIEYDQRIDYLRQAYDEQKHSRRYGLEVLNRQLKDTAGTPVCRDRRNSFSPGNFQDTKTYTAKEMIETMEAHVSQVVV